MSVRPVRKLITSKPTLEGARNLLSQGHRSAGSVAAARIAVLRAIHAHTAAANSQRIAKTCVQSGPERRGLAVVATHFSFWRTSAADGIYSQPGFLLRAGNENQSRYVGGLQDLAIRCRADRHTTFEALATYYEAGAFLREGSSPGKNLSYFCLKMNYRF